jgi:aspartate/methionine/tyrosine aminotransferase
VARYLGARVTRFPRRHEDGFRIDPDEVRRAITPATRLVVLTNLHNPSSAYTDVATLRQIGELASTVGARVLVDEVYLDARFQAEPETSFHLGPEFVVTSSLTKVYGLNGLRCGWILADAALAGRLWRLNELFSNIGAHPAERLSVAAFRDLDQISARSRTILEANTAVLNDFYRSRHELDWHPHTHGTVSFPRLHAGSADALCDHLRERHRTSVVPGRFFEMPEHFRIALGVFPDRFAAGLERLGLALDELG